MSSLQFKTGSNPLCFRCGRSHHKDDYCQAKGKSCFICHGPNHFNTQCKYFQLENRNNTSNEYFSVIDDMKRTIDKLREITLCAVCLEYGSKDKIQCVKGHLVCASHDKRYMKKCPTCRLDFSDNKPSIILSQITEALSKNCKHRNCYKLIDGEMDHEEYCEFKDTECLFNECKWKGPVNSLIKHATETHPEQEIFGDNNQMIWAGSYIKKYSPDYRHLATLYYFDGHLIWEKSYILSDFDELFMRFYLVPNGKPKGDIMVEISFKSTSREHIHKIRLDVDHGENEFALSRLLIPKFVDKDGNLTYTLKFSYV